MSYIDPQQNSNSPLSKSWICIYLSDFYILSNFINLSEESKIFLSNKKFVIIEHDYKFLPERNPTKYINFLVPKKRRLNVKFYYDAIAVFAQSKFHGDILKKNLPFANIINLSGSFFSKQNIEILEKYKNSIKNKTTVLLLVRVLP